MPKSNKHKKNKHKRNLENDIIDEIDLNDENTDDMLKNLKIMQDDIKR